jgi:hypothetical protein
MIRNIGVDGICDVLQAVTPSIFQNEQTRRPSRL